MIHVSISSGVHTLSKQRRTTTYLISTRARRFQTRIGTHARTRSYVDGYHKTMDFAW